MRSAAMQQDELNLFLLNELERLNLLIESLQKRGVVRDEDVVLAQLQQELKAEQRNLRVADSLKDVDALNKAEAAVADLQARISLIEKHATSS